MHQQDVLSWDIFCSVIDNFGDIGVCWRLANLLTHQHQQNVRLWVDDLQALHTLVPATKVSQKRQTLNGITVGLWHDDLTKADFQTIPNVVVEAFGCAMPETYLQAMGELKVSNDLNSPRPGQNLSAGSESDAVVWINLEYLSAEPWVVDCHGLGALQPNGLKRYFYFPGMTSGTGGLMREADYFARQQAFQATQVQQAWCEKWQLPYADAQTFKVSLFAYENLALPALITQWQQSERPILAYLPEGKLLQSFNQQFALNLVAGQVWQEGNVILAVMPFLPQAAYDELLWLCDMNFVRGEESFVRAQWAGKPFVWHIYPTEDEAHWEKLQAFFDIYQAPDILNQLMVSWNRQCLEADDWRLFEKKYSVLVHHSQNWVLHLKSLGELSTNLLNFANQKMAEVN